MPRLPQNRLEEIIHSVASDELRHAVVRLLDLARDSELPAFVDEATVLSARLACVLKDERLNHPNWDQRKNELRSAVLTSAREIMGRVGCAPGSDTPPLPWPGHTCGPVLVETEELAKTLASPTHRFRLKGISLRLRAGELTVVVGRNGSGKTTLLRILAGELQHEAGTLRFPGIHDGPLEWWRVRRHIAYVPQTPNPWLGRLSDNLHMIAAIHGTTGTSNARLVDWVIARLGLEHYRSCPFMELSDGTRARSHLALALVQQPRLLILDEPLASLDLHAQHRFLQDIRELTSSARTPMATVLTSQHVQPVEVVMDRALVLSAGEMKFCGTLDDLGQLSPAGVIELLCKVENLDDFLEKEHAATVDRAGAVSVIGLSPGASPEGLLEKLIAINAKILLFRNISHSLRRFFMADRADGEGDR